MDMAISNIAWSRENEDQVFELLQQHKIKFLEIAPTKIASWQDFSAFEKYKEKVSKYGLTIRNMQSIFYGEKIDIFDNQIEAQQHTIRVLNLAKMLDIKSVIFGSPKNRLTHDKIADKDKFRQFLFTVDDYLASTNIMFNIESNPEVYGCNFITKPSEIIEFSTSFSNIGFHLDTCCSTYSGEPLFYIKDITPDSVHISESYLGNFRNPFVDHQKYKNFLNKNMYSGIISIEMKETDVPDIEHAISFVKHQYETI